MAKALGMIEFKTVSTGVTAADAMVKTAAVELIEAQTVCPGKYIALIIDNLNHDASLSDLLNPAGRINRLLERYRNQKR